MRRVIGWLALSVLFSACALAQTAAPLTFEVASVRAVSQSLGTMLIEGGPGTATPDRLRIQSGTFNNLLMRAFGVRQILYTGPSWGFQAYYDITAKVPAGTTKEQMNVMLQNLLMERFQIKLRRETKTIPIYELSVASGGTKLKSPAPGSPADILEFESQKGPDRISRGRSALVPAPKGLGYLSVGFDVPISDTLRQLEFLLGRTPIVDKTGLTGTYNIKLAFVSGSPSRGAEPSSSPELPKALQEQLGLKLTKGSGEYETLVVESAERVPTEN